MSHVHNARRSRLRMQVALSAALCECSHLAVVVQMVRRRAVVRALEAPSAVKQQQLRTEARRALRSVNSRCPCCEVVIASNGWTGICAVVMYA